MGVAHPLGWSAGRVGCCRLGGGLPHPAPAGEGRHKGGYAIVISMSNEIRGGL